MYPILSVIIPIYNCSLYIEQCLNSVLNQSLTDIEVICIDDGSSDNSYQILKKICSKDSRLILLKQHHRGAGAARNTGISLAHGKYIHFLDSDDWLESNAYEVAINNIENTDADVLIFNEYTYNNKTKQIKESAHTYEKTLTNIIIDPDLLVYGSVVPWNKIIKRSLINKHNIFFDEILCANDRFFYFSLIQFSKNILFINNRLIYYRIGNPNSLTGQIRSKKFYCHFISLDNIINIYNNQNQDLFLKIIDSNLLDLFYFYDRASFRYKLKIYSQMHRYFNSNKSIEYISSTDLPSSERFNYIKNTPPLMAIVNKLKQIFFIR